MHVFASALLRSLSPAIPSGKPGEAVRAGIGALIGLAVAGLLAATPGVDGQLGLYLIAPFGATSVLVFAVPNSPLAQPWSAMVGNTSAAVIGVAVCLSVPDPVIRVALAVGLAIAAMILLRAVHPPAGAVAMTAAMNRDAIQELGYVFALSPVALGTAILVATAVVYARMTRRRYPFRHFEDKGPYGTADASPTDRLGLSEAELTDILNNYRQSLNLGVEDLARLISAAELQAASHRTGPLTAEDIMSRDLVSISPDTPLGEIADLFRVHGFTSLPVVEKGDRFLGIIFQIHLIRRARNDALRLDRGFGYAMNRLIDRARNSPARAADIMEVAVPRAAVGTPATALLTLMSDGKCDAVPVLEHDRIIGIVTQTDLIAALVRQTVRRDDSA